MTVNLSYNIPIEGWEGLVLLTPKCCDVVRRAVLRTKNINLASYIIKELILENESREVNIWKNSSDTNAKFYLNFRKTHDFFAFFI